MLFPTSSDRESAPRPGLAPEVHGQDAARSFLSLAMAAGRLAHAYLLVGPEGVGKRRFADAFSRALLCGDSGEGGGDPAAVGACGTCPSCRIALDTHPGRELIAPADAGSSIEIAAVREAIAALALRSGDRRAVVIDGADLLGDAAANALLKTLEEPPPGIVFLLVTHRPAHLLDTIHSRAQRIPFAALDEASSLAVLGPLPAGVDGHALFRSTGGSPGRGVRLLRGIEACGGAERFAELIAGRGGEDPSALIDYLPALPKERVRSRALRLLELVQLGVWGARGESAHEREQAARRALLVAELIRGLEGGRSVELTLEVLARVLTTDARTVERGLPRSFFAGGR